MDKKVKLLIITQKVDKNDPVLGFFVRWVEEFAKHCESIIVICLQEGKHNLPENVQVLSLGKEEKLKTKNYKLKALFRFYKYVFQQRKSYGAVFVHMNPEYIVLAGALWRLWGKKVGLWYVHKSVNLKLRIAEKFVHAVFTASQESFRLKSKKVHILGHGIDVSQFESQKSKVESGVLQILTIGRFAPSKGIDTILDAVAELEIPFQLVIAGAPATAKDIAYEQAMREYAESLGVADSVVFKGAVSPDDIPELLAQADVFVSASTTGSIDKVVLEALAARVPAIAPEGAYKDLLGESRVYAEGDAHALAEKIRAVHAQPEEEKRALSERLYEKIEERYSVEKLIPRILKLYDNTK